MRNVIVWLSVFLTVTLCTTALADGTSGTPSGDIKLEQYIQGIYRQIDFGNGNHLSYDVFSKAYRGYMNLLDAGKVTSTHQLLTVCDMSKPSVYKRMWVIDLDNKKVLFNNYVAHGQGSGDDGDLSFSNHESTHKSSLGFYVTGSIYDGSHGTSLHLNGMDNGFNDAAYDRDIVVHGADYVSDAFIAERGRLGRSWGCPAVPPTLCGPIIDAIKDNTCLFIYYPDTRYLKSSVWLNRQVSLPENGMLAETLPTETATAAPHTRIVQYTHNGVVDSVKTVSMQ